jgi:hypothetical protein
VTGQAIGQAYLVLALKQGGGANQLFAIRQCNRREVAELLRQRIFKRELEPGS